MAGQSCLRLRVDELARLGGKTALDVALAVIIFVLGAISETESKLHGVEIRFGAEGISWCDLVYDDVLRSSEEHLLQLKDEVTEALLLDGEDGHEEAMAHRPFGSVEEGPEEVRLIASAPGSARDAEPSEEVPQLDSPFCQLQVCAAHFEACFGRLPFTPGFGHGITRRETPRCC